MNDWQRRVRNDQGPVYAYFFVWGVGFGLVGGAFAGLMAGMAVGLVR